MDRPSGYILHDTKDIVVIATMETENPKIGDMIQVWILCRNLSPMEALYSGKDSLVCFDCKMRPKIVDGEFEQGPCYVSVWQAPTAVWNKYQRGGYPHLEANCDEYLAVFRGRKVRFGAYGDPVRIPMRIMLLIDGACDGHTGYTHQWDKPKYQAYRHFIMASVDSEAEYVAAKAAGWRTFRCRTADNALTTTEVVCPASDEAGKRTTCADCLLCSGTYDGDPRKDIAIIVHGKNADKFVQLGVN